MQQTMKFKQSWTVKFPTFLSTKCEDIAHDFNSKTKETILSFPPNPYWCSRIAICTYSTSFGVRRLVLEWELPKLLNRTFGPRISGTSSPELIEKHSNMVNFRTILESRQARILYIGVLKSFNLEPATLLNLELKL